MLFLRHVSEKVSFQFWVDDEPNEILATVSLNFGKLLSPEINIDVVKT